MKKYIFSNFTLFVVMSSLCTCVCAASLTADDAVTVTQENAYDQFPEMDCSLPELKDMAKQMMEDDHMKARRLKDEIDRRMSLDPEFSKLSFSDAEKFGGLTNLSWKPYNHNRLGRDNPSIYLGASEVHTEHQDFILASCPRTPDEFVGVLMHFLEKIESHGVWVSLLSSHEAKNYCNNFWKEKFLRQLTFPGGWSIKEVTSSIIGGSFDGSGPSLTKTLIELECGKISKTIVHYHYDKWIDRTVVPDEELLLILLDEMEANSEETSPIVINCIGGVGRTGMTTAAYILRKEIQINLSQGVLPKDVFINVPETLYALLKQRTHLMNDPKHMNKMYSVLAKYYEKISSEKDLLLPDITPQPSRN